IHRCNKCYLVIDRDYNASVNILNKGLNIFDQSPQATISVPQELRELTPVEISMRSRKQEAHVL
ncbi:MAG: transposase, partial [Nitrosopumilus sp. CG10_big_fil_rev_8_21_14_0_10_33_7]